MLEGIITPIVTPFNRDEEQSINYDATKELIEYLLKNKVSGIFALGTNGEFHVLSHQEKIEFVKKVVGFVNHRVPVFAGCGACSTKEAISLAKEMELAGADFLSVINPYFVNLSNQEMFEYYKDIADSVNIPIILYNIPKNSGEVIPYEVAEKLSKISNVFGIKDSSGDVNLLKKYIEITKKQDFQVFVGSDSKISIAYKLGIRSAIAGTSNLLSETLVALNNSLIKGTDDAEVLQESIEHLREVLKLGPVPSVLKRSLELANIAEVGPARKPEIELSSEDDEKIIQMLNQYKNI